MGSEKKDGRPRNNAEAVMLQQEVDFSSAQTQHSDEGSTRVAKDDNPFQLD